MANRHKFKKGGAVPLASGNKDVAEEAHEKKKGGACKKDGGAVPGLKAGGRLDKFARGGRAGADKSPFSSAKF